MVCVLIITIDERIIPIYLLCGQASYKGYECRLVGLVVGMSYPQQIIVRPENTSSATHDFLKLENFRFSLQKENQSTRRKIFSSIIMIKLIENHLSSLTRHRRLKEVFMKETDISRINRLEERLLFFVIHFQGFFDRTLHHTA